MNEQLTFTKILHHHCLNEKQCLPTQIQSPGTANTDVIPRQNKLKERQSEYPLWDPINQENINTANYNKNRFTI